MSPSTRMRSPPLAVHVSSAVLCASASCAHSSGPSTTARSDVYPSQLAGSRDGWSGKSITAPGPELRTTGGGRAGPEPPPGPGATVTPAVVIGPATRGDTLLRLVEPV